MIMERTFQGCKGMTSITIPKDVEVIGYMAFFRFGNNATVTILRNNTEIGTEAFSGSSVKAIYVPKGSLNFYKSMKGFPRNCIECLKEVRN